MEGESVVMVGSEPARLAFKPVSTEGLRVRSRYAAENSAVVYESGRDYTFNPVDATLLRLPGSRMPDFRTNMLFGKQDFDHSKFPGFGNTGFFVFVDYVYRPTNTWPIQPKQLEFLSQSQAKLNDGGEFRIVAFGDSITAGGDATHPDRIFWKRWANRLQQRYPRAKVNAINGATGGDSTVQGLQRLEAKVLKEKPDLVLLGFGMNDHNKGGVPIPQFESNLKQIIDRIRRETRAEVILFSAFPPNPNWHYGTHRMQEYAASTRRVAAESRVAYADVFTNWQSLAERKKPEDLLGNNINHPNDFGHWIYFQVIDALGL